MRRLVRSIGSVYDEGMKDNLWVNLLCNAVVPAVILSVGGPENRLGPAGALVTALAFPVGYNLWDLLRRRAWNVLAVLGLLSTLVSGGLGLMKMSGFWFAVKEGALPVVFGLAVPLSLRSRQPLIRVLLFNDQVLDTQRISHALASRGNLEAFDRLLGWASWMVAGAMFLGGLVNFALAWWLLPAQAGTPEFSRQLGKLQFWSWSGTVLPTGAMFFYALWRLIAGVEHLTNLKGSELFHAPR
jgi:hypothetical protein